MQSLRALYRYTIAFSAWLCAASVWAQSRETVITQEEYYVQQPDGAINYVRVLQKEDDGYAAVVLVPSLGRGVDDFTQKFGSTLVADLVEQEYLVVLIEPRGIGKSTGTLDPKTSTMETFASDIEEVLDHLGLEKAAFVGHAFGNRLSRYFAATRPDRIEALALLAAGGDFELSQGQRKCLLGSFNLAAPRDQRRKDIQCAFFAKGNNPDIWLEGWFPRLAKAQIAAAQSVNSADFKTAGGYPFLVVQPAEDFIALKDLAGIPLAKELGDQVSYIEIAGSGHALVPEQPKAVSDAVSDYFAYAIEDNILVGDRAKKVKPAFGLEMPDWIDVVAATNDGVTMKIKTDASQEQVARFFQTDLKRSGYAAKDTITQGSELKVIGTNVENEEIYVWVIPSEGPDHDLYLVFARATGDERRTKARMSGASGELDPD